MATAIEIKTDYFAVAREYLEKCYVGYGTNDINLPLMLWVSAGTRLLEYPKGKGEILAHTWLQGPAGVGKNYAFDRARDLINDDAVVHYSSESQRAFARDKTDIRHRVVYFEEADSLPMSRGGFNPLSDAMRLALVNGDFRYTSSDLADQRKLLQYEREGPFVLWSTHLKMPETQMMSRMFVSSIQVPTADIIKARSRFAFKVASAGWPERPESLRFHQSELQKSAPIKVAFDDEMVELLYTLSDELAIQPRTASRIAYMLKSIALLSGRIIVIPDDYGRLYDMNMTTEFLTASLNAGTTSNLFKVIMAIDKLKKDHAAAYRTKHFATIAKNDEKFYARMVKYEKDFAEWKAKGSDENWGKPTEPKRWDFKDPEYNYLGLTVTTTMLVDETGIGHTQMGETLNEGVEQGHILNAGTRNRADWHLTRERIPQVAGLPSLIDLRLAANGQK